MAALIGRTLAHRGTRHGARAARPALALALWVEDHQGLGLGRSQGKRDLVPPGGPRHPRYGKGPMGPEVPKRVEVVENPKAPGAPAGAGAADCVADQPPGGRYVDAALAASSISSAVTSTTVRTLAAPLALTASAAPAAVILSG
jgi:hypothetical protein